MALLDLTLVKRHLRVTHDEDDAEISAYQGAAENIAIQYLDREVLPEGSALPAEGEVGYDPYTMLITPAITAAVLLLIGDFYEHREPDMTADGNAVLPRHVRALLAPWRVWRTVEP